MYIPNAEWDELNARSADVVEALEKEEIHLTSLVPFIKVVLYDIIHMQDKPVPKIICEKWYKKLLRKASCKKRK